MKLSDHLYHPLSIQLMRFGTTGGVAVAVHFLTAILLVKTTTIDPLYTNVIGYLCGFVASFVGHRYWIFSDTTRHLATSLTRFCLIAALDFFINQGLFYLLFVTLLMAYLPTLIIALTVTGTSSFLLSKYWAFSK